MANDKFISSENLFAWGSSFNTTKKIPVIAKRVWQTYEDMFNYVSDSSDTCIAGIVLTVVNDEDVTKNGAYFVVSCPTLEEPTIIPAVKKIGSDEGISEDINDIKTLLGDASSGLVKDVEDIKSTKADASTVYTKGEADDKYVAQEGYVAYTQDEKDKLAGLANIKSVGDNLNVDASGKLTVTIPEIEVPFQSVDVNDKVLTLDGGVLSSTINLTIDTEADADGKKYIRLTGKNSENLGKIDIADFVVDGMLDSVTEKDGTTLVFTWNEASGKTTTTEIDFSKYVDTYAADGSTLELDSNNKTFSVKENVFVKTEGYVAYSEAEKTKLASIEENAQVNTIESITLNNEALDVVGKNINIDLSAYALNASVNDSLDLKANVADVYDTSTVDNLLGAKVDSSAYGIKVEEIDGSITTINAELAKKADASTVEEALAGKVDASAGYSLVEDSLITKLGNMVEIKSVGDNLAVDGSGKLNVDLSSYATIADTSANFVQKDGNKVLSTNDFTDELKAKLEGIEAGAEVNYIKSVGNNLDVDASGKLTVDLSSKLDATATVNGVEFTNGDATIDADDIKASVAFGKVKEGETTRDRYTTDDSVQSILSSLDSRIDSINTIFDETFEGVIVSVQGSNAIGVTEGTNPEISLKVSKETDNVASVKSDGVYVPDMRSYWESI